MTTTPKDFVLTIGGEFYSRESFLAEAATMGISRRLRSIPKDLKVGESRVYLAFGCGRDSAPRKCDGEMVVAGKTVPCDNVKLPMPAENDAGELVCVCPVCDKSHDVRKRPMGEISHYFTPQAVDVVIRISDARARELAVAYKGLGVLDAELEETPDVLRVACTITEGNSEVLEILSEFAGVEISGDVQAAAIQTTNSRIMMVAKEPNRGCGQRKTGGQYLVAQVTNGQAPVTELDPVVLYDAPHFRGIRELAADDAVALREQTDNGKPVGILRPAVPVREVAPDRSSAARKAWETRRKATSEKAAA